MLNKSSIPFRTASNSSRSQFLLVRSISIRSKIWSETLTSWAKCCGELTDVKRQADSAENLQRNMIKIEKGLLVGHCGPMAPLPKISPDLGLFPTASRHQNKEEFQWFPRLTEFEYNIFQPSRLPVSFEPCQALISYKAHQRANKKTWTILGAEKQSGADSDFDLFRIQLKQPNLCLFSNFERSLPKFPRICTALQKWQQRSLPQDHREIIRLLMWLHGFHSASGVLNVASVVRMKLHKCFALHCPC